MGATFGSAQGDGQKARGAPRGRTIESVELVVGVLIGLAFGVIVMGFIAIQAYEDGWDAARRATHQFLMRRERAKP